MIVWDLKSIMLEFKRRTKSVVKGHEIEIEMYCTLVHVYREEVNNNNMSQSILEHISTLSLKERKHFYEHFRSCQNHETGHGEQINEKENSLDTDNVHFRNIYVP